MNGSEARLRRVKGLTYAGQRERVGKLEDLKDVFVGDDGGDVGGPPQQNRDHRPLAGRHFDPANRVVRLHLAPSALPVGSADK